MAKRKTSLTRAEKIRALWQDPKYRAKHERTFRSKEYKEKKSAAHKAIWKDPAYRKKRSCSLKKAMASPEYHVKQSANRQREWANGIRSKKAAARFMKKRWKDPEYRQSVLSKTGNNLKKAAKRNWKNPVLKEKLLRHLQTFSKTPEQRKRNSDRTKANWANPSFRRRMIQMRKDSYTPERIEKMAAANRGRTPWNKGLTKDSHPSLASASVKLKGHIPDYNKYRAWYRGRNGKIRMRSKWKVAYAQYLDRTGVEWQYEPKRFYVGKGNWVGECYIPDFWLPKKKLYIEVKGRMSDFNTAKMAAFRTQYPKVKLEVLFGHQLKQLGVVDIHGCAILC